MQRHPHTRPHHHPQTPIGILRGYLEGFRKANGWSRESLAQAVVEAHDAVDGPLTTGVMFDPPTRDTYERMRVNADRVFRWLDDQTKDRNLLPLNLLPSVLAALPEDLRRHAVDDLLRPVGLACRVQGMAEVIQIAGQFGTMMKEAAEAEIAVANLLDGIAPGELETAQRELTEGVAAFMTMLQAVEAALREREA